MGELIELALKLQRPAKASRTSSKPPSTDRKERREQSRPDGIKPGYEGHSRVIAEEPDQIVAHRPTACPDCGLALSPVLLTEAVSVQERIELPEVKPLVEQHRRLVAVCPGCRARAASTPLGPAAARYGFVPEDLLSPILQASAEDLVRPVRPSYEPCSVLYGYLQVMHFCKHSASCS